MGDRRPVALIVAVAGIVLVFDQVIKAAIVAAIGPGQATASIPISGTLLSLEYVENRGAAFGLFVGAGPVLLVAGALLLGMLTWSVLRAPKQPHHQVVAFGLILGGALGNLLDRIRLGYVIDFISVGWWPNFNLADSAITIGVVLMLYSWLFAGPRGQIVHPGSEPTHG